MLNSQIGGSQIVLLNFLHSCETGRLFVSAPLSTFILAQAVLIFSLTCF